LAAEHQPSSILEPNGDGHRQGHEQWHEREREHEQGQGQGQGHRYEQGHGLNTYQSQTTTRDQGDDLELVFDPILNSYFDPVTGAYYTLNNPGVC
jgi:uncharacterized protein with LGFP repeats